MRLGFSVRVLGQRGLRAFDSRRPVHAPHLSMSLAHLRDVFAYLERTQITMYRLSSELVPYALHPATPAWQEQIEECAPDLAALGAIARERALRLSFHAPMHVHLGSSDDRIVERAADDLLLLTAILDAMQLDLNAVIVVHVGGSYGAPNAALSRWVTQFDRLPPCVQQRLVLEHDDADASLGRALRIHAATGVPLVFDYLHFCLNNPERWSLAEGIAVALATWPYDRTPKIHFSSPRTELRVVEHQTAASDRRQWVLRPPRPGHHADFINAWEFAHLLTAARASRDFDVMLEAKASDVALIRLRQDLARYVPEYATMVHPSALAVGVT